MTYEIKHYHYHRLMNDPEIPDTIAIFKVFKRGALDVEAVVREVRDRAANDPPGDLRVDCRSVDDGLRQALTEYFPGRELGYCPDPAWSWSDNGTYEEMPWSGKVEG